VCGKAMCGKAKQVCMWGWVVGQCKGARASCYRQVMEGMEQAWTGETKGRQERGVRPQGLKTRPAIGASTAQEGWNPVPAQAR